MTTTFKVGDIVKLKAIDTITPSYDNRIYVLTNRDGDYNGFNTNLEIREIGSRGPYSVLCRVNNRVGVSNKEVWFREEDLIKVDKRKVYKVGDEVIFKTKKGVLEYKVEFSYLKAQHGGNELIFNYLNIKDKYNFCKKIYGYESYFGEFPSFKNDDMVACNKVINALLDLCENEDSIKYIKVKPIIIKYNNEF